MLQKQYFNWIKNDFEKLEKKLRVVGISHTEISERFDLLTFFKEQGNDSVEVNFS